jgi:uncharacterized membrane protein
MGLDKITDEERQAQIDNNRIDTDFTSRFYRKMVANSDIWWMWLAIICAVLLGAMLTFLSIAFMLYAMEVDKEKLINSLTTLLSTFLLLVSALGSYFGYQFNIRSKTGFKKKQLQKVVNKDKRELDDNLNTMTLD